MLSILIPTYNYNVLPLVTELHRQADSLDIVYEIVVVDDYSEQKFTEGNSTIASLNNCRFIENETNLGRTLSRKKLADEAKYAMLLFLDADVIPVNADFIENYIPYIKQKSPVVFGGYKYIKQVIERDKELRYKYGICREEKTANERSKNPYGTIFSGNLLIEKMVFINSNFSGGNNLYGMDIYFCYRLYKHQVPVIHIDNPIYHLGLEINDVFFKKTIEAVKNRKVLFSDIEDAKNINSLLKHYQNLQKYHLTKIVKFGFAIIEPLLKKMILKRNPNLFCLDIYRLGYICSLK
ncbi:glycosyltransferase family 2 protein [Flavobacterium salilacus subsp. salilacus]|uniref:glycosyltransferase family 2 protein n=1 Tax=Flavobacterium TaxID=237 RepID=UPI0010757692|nr:MULTISPECIES: glycosyltransferase [Flavobacterium]KAF2516906.1 glycosyltransferase family 2 protein [Flavobacterium salilacus subsp. salilacus]MBE1615734.1 glycosyltransferase [Flavobacterium sp. SaA2.13]